MRPATSEQATQSHGIPIIINQYSRRPVDERKPLIYWFAHITATIPDNFAWDMSQAAETPVSLLNHFINAKHGIKNAC